MRSKLGKSKSQGFTIIEVLIVLAIAGLILLIVFLAIPALQRNSRNTQRNNDVASLLGGMSEYVTNNNGRLPQGLEASETSVTFTGGTGQNTNHVSVDLGFYAGDEVSLTSSIPGSGDDAQVSEDTVRIITGAVCDGTSVKSGSSRSYVAYYQLENDATQCRAS